MSGLPLAFGGGQEISQGTGAGVLPLDGVLSALAHPAPAASLSHEHCALSQTPRKAGLDGGPCTPASPLLAPRQSGDQSVRGPHKGRRSLPEDPLPCRGPRGKGVPKLQGSRGCEPRKGGVYRVCLAH